LGTREPQTYGQEDLESINKRVSERAAQLGVETAFYQSNIEGELVGWIQSAPGNYDGLLVNAGGYTHTSVAIRDALAAIRVPFVEVHISNVFAREPFRHHSHLSDIALGLITGFGGDSYILALQGLVDYLRRR